MLSHRIHLDPCSDVLFAKEAVYTASFCGQIRCWRRPEKLPLEHSSRQTSASLASDDGTRQVASASPGEEKTAAGYH